MGRHGLVKSCVEDRHLWDSREAGSGGFYAKEIGRVMEWGQRYKAADGGNYLRIHQGRLPEEFSTMNNTMANAEQLRIILNDPVFTVHVRQEVKCVVVIGQSPRMDLLIKRPVSVVPALTQKTLTITYLLDESCYYHSVVRYAKDFILDGGTPAVHNSDFHGVIPHPCA
jgi:hypothetical protein